MKNRKTLVSMASAAALTLAISGSALAAAPTFFGVATCTEPETGIVHVELDFTDWTKKNINAHKRFWTQNGTCVKGWDWAVDVTKNA